MSNRYQAGIVLPGYNALKVANAPTIGTATSASGTSVSVTFTAPSCVGGGAISSYTVFANCGLYTASGASSPLVVTGLTTGTAYTFKAIATNAYGPSYPSAASNSATPVLVVGQQAYTSSGTFTWVAPTGVNAVSVVTVGAGSSSGQAGALSYKNNISVTPGSSYCVVVPAGNSATRASFNGNGTVSAGRGARTGDGGGCGGTGFGGGGAGGYAGNGGDGGAFVICAARAGSAGSGGGGGGGGAFVNDGAGVSGAGGGGGVGILGQGANGAGGSATLSSAGGGGGGSGGTCGGSVSSGSGAAGVYGGAGGSAGSGSNGAGGAVRIIWPGTTRSFPSTCTGNL